MGRVVEVDDNAMQSAIAAWKSRTPFRRPLLSLGVMGKPYATMDGGGGLGGATSGNSVFADRPTEKTSWSEQSCLSWKGDNAMAAPNHTHRIMTGDAATTYEAEPPSSRRRDAYRPIIRLSALLSGGLLSLQCVIPMAADAQTDPPTLATPGAAAAIADRKSLSSETIIRDSLTGKAIIIVGGSGRLGSKVVRDPNGVGSLNPQPLPPDPPPNALDYLKMDLPAAVIRKPIIPRGNGVGSLNPQPLPPVSGH